MTMLLDVQSLAWGLPWQYCRPLLPKRVLLLAQDHHE